jgi:hypothetical protein
MITVPAFAAAVIPAAAAAIQSRLLPQKHSITLTTHPCALLLLLLLPPTAVFLLPLCFPAQLALTVAFFAVHFPAICPQASYALQVLVQCVPRAVLLQARLESTLAVTVATLIAPLLRTRTGGAAALAVLPQPLISAVLQCSSSRGPASPAQQRSLLLLMPADWDKQPGRTPDINTLAGRFVLAWTSAYICFAVLLLPLYCAWIWERRMKAKWVAQQQQQQQTQQSQQRGRSRLAAAGSNPDCPNSSSGVYVQRPSFGVTMPPARELTLHLVLMAAAAAAFGQVWLLASHWTAVQAHMGQQVAYPWPDEPNDGSSCLS